MAKAYYRVSEFKQEILDNREKTFGRGFDIGFYSAYNYINYKKGTTSYLYAHPFSGKTSLEFDTYMYIAKKYNEVIAIYSPEAGDRTALTSYLVQVYLGKKLHGQNAQYSSDEEWLQALEFIDKHFVLLDPKLVGKEKLVFSAQEMFNQIYMAQKEYDIKISLALIDPYNLLSKSEEDRKKSISDYTLDNLYYINSVAQEMDMHIRIATHLRDEETIIDKDSGVEYMSRPFPNKVAQGQAWWRTGKIMMGLWRCPSGVIEKRTGLPYPENASDILIQKNKVFGAGETGEFRLFFDDERQKFYEIIDNKKYYCGEYEEYMNRKIKTKEPSLIKPNYNFQKIEMPDGSPF